jgi:DHA2 family multidrug resistance protein
VLSADDIFYASAIIFLVLLPFVWLARPRMGAGADAGGAH